MAIRKEDRMEDTPEVNALKKELVIVRKENDNRRRENIKLRTALAQLPPHQIIELLLEED